MRLFISRGIFDVNCAVWYIFIITYSFLICIALALYFLFHFHYFKEIGKYILLTMKKAIIKL